MSTQEEVTQMLIDWGNGNKNALEKLMPIVYGRLRRLAANCLRQQRPNHTLQATALVHEAYMRLIDWKHISWQNRAHFFSVAAQLMRKILVDHARKHLASKRGGGMFKITFDDARNMSDGKDLDLIALDDALATLAAIDPQQSRIIELRY